jgi:predicted GNAT family N-acyltransferase
MSSYHFVEQIDDRLRGDLMELYRHEWWTNQRRDEDVARMLQHTDLVVGVCSDDGRLVGFTRVLTDRVFKAVIFDVIVARDHRGDGLGKRLIDYVLDHPMVAAVRHVELYCKPEMIPFYRKWGFTAPGDDVNFLRIEGRGEACDS